MGVAQLAASTSGTSETFSSQPLADLLIPLRRFAEQRIPAAAQPDCLDFLESRLQALMSPAVDVEFRSWRAANPRADWSGWVRDQHEQGLQPLWRTYPALARLVGTLLVDVVARVEELRDRFEIDHSALATRLGARKLSLTRVAPLGGDLHNGHAFVMRCTVATDTGDHVDIVYKPRPCDGERFLADLTRLLARTGAIEPAPWTLSMNDHGWMEYVRPQPAGTVEEAGSFFRSAAALAAVVFRTGGHDFHAENIIGVGPRCVAIDSETVLAPIVADQDGLTTRETRSVVDALIVPRWTGLRGAAVDLSALGCRLPEATPHGAVLHWLNPGSADARVVARLEPSLAALSPVRSQDGTFWTAEDFEADIIEGFTAGWNAFDALDWTGLDYPPGAIDSMQVRVLMRMTSTYSRVMQTSLEPALLRSGLARSIHLEHLCRPVLDSADPATGLALVDAELRFLEQGTLPAFYTRADDTVLRDSAGIPIATFETTAAQHFRKRREASRESFKDQMHLVRTSLAIAAPGVRRTTIEGERQEIWTTDPDSDPRARSALAALVDRYRLREGLDNPYGPGLKTIEFAQWGIEPWPPGLYDGAAGIATWLFALAAALDDSRIAERAERILTAALDRVEVDPHRTVRRFGVSGQDGLSGIFVGWAACMGMGVGSPTAATRERIANCCGLLIEAMASAARPPDADLLTGGTGLLAGLLAADSLGVNVPPSLRQTALSAVTSDPSRHCGFSHGNSGRIALLVAAKTREWIDDDRIITRLIEDESACFDSRTGNWPRAHAKAGDEARAGWCNGFPGVALARAVVRRDGGPAIPEVAVDLRRSIEGFEAVPTEIDTLCCGLAGRAEILRYLCGDPHQVPQQAMRLSALHGVAVRELADRALKNGLRLGFPRRSPIPPYGLFQGIGGVVYALAAAITNPPHVLTWAPAMLTAGSPSEC